MQLQHIMPTAGLRAGNFLDTLNAAMAEFGINTSARVAAFLAQIAVESGELRYTREIWGPTKWQLAYEGHRGLGNYAAGDGKRYLGRGLIQLTGRYNYTGFGKLLQLPLAEHPELLEQPEAACRSAACYWQSRGLNMLADSGDFAAITRKINGPGMLQQDRRVEFWNVARRELGA